MPWATCHPINQPPTHLTLIDVIFTEFSLEASNADARAVANAVNTGSPIFTVDSQAVVQVDLTACAVETKEAGALVSGNLGVLRSVDLTVPSFLPYLVSAAAPILARTGGAFVDVNLTGIALKAFQALALEAAGADLKENQLTSSFLIDDNRVN